MKKNILFLAHQIARFGALTVPQMLEACRGKCSQATLYRMVDDLIRERLVKRMFLGDQSKHLFAAKPSLYEMMYGKDHRRSTGVNECNNHHTALVAETLLTICRYSFTSGVATEYEIMPYEMKQFCYSRIPDGIIQITNSTQSFSLAVEVERSRKDESRIHELLEKYQQTFQRQMPCGGLLVVTGNSTIAELYHGKVSKMPSDIESRILVTTIDDLSKLNSKYFGEFQQSPSIPLEKIVNFTQGLPTFSPMFSCRTEPLSPHLHKGSQSLQKEINYE